MKAAVEGLLFVVGNEGMDLGQLSALLELDQKKVVELLNQMESEYQKEDRGIHLELLGETFKLTTKKEHKAIYEKLVEIEENSFLSQAALETLAIIAYNEPITRSVVDEIRGVSSSHMIRKLLSKNLIQELGRSDLPGRPHLYGTTKQFLDYFGLSKKEDLPKIEAIQKEEDLEKDLFESRYEE